MSISFTIEKKHSIEENKQNFNFLSLFLREIKKKKDNHIYVRTKEGRCQFIKNARFKKKMGFSN